MARVGADGEDGNVAVVQAGAFRPHRLHAIRMVVNPDLEPIIEAVARKRVPQQIGMVTFVQEQAISVRVADDDAHLIIGEARERAGGG